MNWTCGGHLKKSKRDNDALKTSYKGKVFREKKNFNMLFSIGTISPLPILLFI